MNEFLTQIPWAEIGRALTIAAPGLVALAGLFRGTGPQRARLREDVEMLAMLPEGSTSRSTLERWVNTQIEDLRTFDSSARRDVPMLVFSIVAAIGLAYLTIYLVEQSTWWGFTGGALAGTLALVFLYGIFECAQRVPRDAKGKRLSDSP